MVNLDLHSSYLTGNPQITFFKSVYRRHTNFSMETNKLTFNGNNNFGGNVSCTIPKGADLLHKLFVKIELSQVDVSLSAGSAKAFRWLNWIGHKLIKKAEVKISGNVIDTHKGEWLHIRNELSQKDEKSMAYAEMVGNVPGLTQIHSMYNTTDSELSSQKLIDSYTLFVPLQFWFCKNPGLSIPIVSLNQPVYIDIEFENLDEVIWATEESSDELLVQTGKNIFGNSPPTMTASLYSESIFLDQSEKTKFMNTDHEYLIETIFDSGDDTINSNSTTYTHKMAYNFPVKEIIWIIQPQDFILKSWCQSRGGFQWFNYSDSFDYSGFTGTPENSFGPGMSGGRKQQNLWYGLPSVKLPFDTNTFEPKFNSIDYSSANNATSDWLTNESTKLTKSSTTTSVKNSLKTSGYNFVTKYHSNEDNSYINSFTDKNIENMLGNTGIVQLDQDSNNKLGIWSNAGLNMKLTDSSSNPTKRATLRIDGIKKVDDLEGTYFNLIQPYNYHTNVPAVGINVYSFSLKPEDYQPSGTCNFNYIDNAELNISLSTMASRRTCIMRSYCVCYQILSIKNKMAKLVSSPN